jgi:hypothetical protein
MVDHPSLVSMPLSSPQKMGTGHNNIITAKIRMLTLLFTSDPAASVDIQSFSSVKREKEFKNIK